MRHSLYSLRVSMHLNLSISQLQDLGPKLYQQERVIGDDGPTLSKGCRIAVT